MENTSKIEQLLVEINCNLKALSEVNKARYLQRKPIIDGAEICLILGISKRSLGRLRASGKVGHVRLAGRYFYNNADFQAYLLSRMEKTHAVGYKVNR